MSQHIEISVASDVQAILARLGHTPLIRKAISHAMKRAGINLRANVAREIAKEAYLKSGKIKRHISRRSSDSAITIVVDSKRLAAHEYKLVPNRVTAKKRMRSRNWQPPGFRIGPREPVRVDATPGFSKPFNIKSAFSGKTEQVHRDLATGRLYPVMGPSVQYFTAFGRVRDEIMAQAQEMFEKRLRHSIEYMLENHFSGK